jgi:flagellar hook-associated protein 3 FlgL
VTDRLALDLLVRRVRDGRARVELAQAQVSSGRRVARPADDPVAYARALGSREAAARASEHAANVARGAAMLDAASGALTEAHEILSRARELAIQAGSDSAGATAREAAAATIDRLRQGLAELRATTSQGEMVFLAAGRERRIEVGPGVVLPASIDGDAVFAGGVDLDATLAALAADMRSGDTAAVRGRLGALAAGLQQVEGGIAEAGARRAAMDIAGQAAERAELALTSDATKAVAADPVRVLGELAASEVALRAALESGLRLVRPILAEKL